MPNASRTRLAHDFMTLALGDGLGERNVTVGVVHPSTGVLSVEYPLSWLGVRLYQVREFGNVGVLPPRFAKAAPTDTVRVLHTPEQIGKDTLIRSSYGAPCVAAWHPSKYHVRENASPNFCGLLGTSHRFVETRLGPVPVVCANIIVPVVQDRIVSGQAEGSSLSYTFGVLWAEEAGDVQCGEQRYGAGDYDVMHDMDTVNHMVTACTTEQSRGGGGARLIFDCATRPGLCYTGRMLFPLTKNVQAALAAKAPECTARDLAVEIPDDVAPQALAVMRALTTTLEAALGERDTLAQQLGEAENAAAAAGAQMATLQEDAAVGRDLAVTAAIKQAAGLGVVVEKKTDKCPHGATTVADVMHATVRAKGAKSYDKVPEGDARNRYVQGAWDSMLSTTESATPTRDTPTTVDPSALAGFLSRRHASKLPTTTPTTPGK
jgi:hypothetical protein